MAAGDLISGPWQVELQGVLMDARGGITNEPLVIVRWLSGFGVPAGRVSMRPRPLRHGEFVGPQYTDRRVMDVAVLARGDTWLDMHDAILELGAAFAPVPDTDPDYVVPMVFTLDDASILYRVEGQPTRAEWGYNAPALFTDGCRFSDVALCEFMANDPAIFSNTVDSATATLGVSSGGHPFPLPAFPHGFGTAISGAALCTNAGNIDTYPTITVTAGGSGASGIALLNETTGDEWSITLSLTAGQYLVVDMKAQTVLLNGTADRGPFVDLPDSVWWAMMPGLNTIRLQATGTGTTALVEWRDAYYF